MAVIECIIREKSEQNVMIDDNSSGPELTKLAFRISEFNKQNLKH